MNIIMHNEYIENLVKYFENGREAIVKTNIVSVRMLVLAMPVLALVIQNGLFLIGRGCSCYPMWISFISCSILMLYLHWKRMISFWGVIACGLLLTCFTFSYYDRDSEVYHFPMQFLLRDGWNPIFDSSIQKFNAIVDSGSLSVYHSLFLPKTTALCGALVAKATGLWIADSFLGYMLLFSLWKTSFLFAGRIWNCQKMSCLLFATIITFTTKLTTLLCGQVDYLMYASMMIAVFSLFLYIFKLQIHDLFLAIVASIICSTVKTTGLINMVVLWITCGMYMWKKKDIYIAFFVVLLFVAWIGMSPLITAWIQYGSPFYPTMTFDPKIATVDITNDFVGNEDGEQMGYLARWVYAWISPKLAINSCSLYYHKKDFHPVFYVAHGVNGFGTGFALLLSCSIVLLALSHKNMVTCMCLYIFFTMIFYPLKYIGYGRYFLQAWVIVPLSFYQFIYHFPLWLNQIPKIRNIMCYCMFFVLLALTIISIMKIGVFQARMMILEGQRQKILSQIKNDGTVFVLPKNSRRTYTLSKRLVCEKIPFEFSQKEIGKIEEDTFFPEYKKYYMEKWKIYNDYPVDNKFSNIFLFKWNDTIKNFPHPLFYYKSI